MYNKPLFLISMIKIPALCFLGICIFSASLFAQQTELLILPTIHTRHVTNPNYSFAHVKRIIENFKPDIIGVEIRPEDMDQDTVYLKTFYQPEMIMTLKGFPGIQKAGIDFMGSDMEGRHLPPGFNRDTTGEMGRFRLTNQKLMRDSQMVKARIAKGLVALKARQSDMMSALSANELLDGSYDRITAEYTQAQTSLLKDTPYSYYDAFGIRRDQRIADNIRDLALKNPGKRIIILTGANHHNRAVNTLSKVKSVHLLNHVMP